MTDSMPDMIIWLDFAFLTLVILLSATVIYKAPETSDKEIMKLRFACVMFTGIMTVFIFTAVLYFGSKAENAGAQIFDRAVSSMTPLAGVILGYLFGNRNRALAELSPDAQEGAGEPTQS
jgi:hypothetical protein